jgi:hypothetical protein
MRQSLISWFLVSILSLVSFVSLAAVAPAQTIAQEQKTSDIWWIATLIGLNAADAVTTARNMKPLSSNEIAAHHCLDYRPGFGVPCYNGHEANPIARQFWLRGPAVGFAYEAGATAVGIWGILKLERHHPKVARVLVFTSIAVESGCIAHNLTHRRK